MTMSTESAASPGQPPPDDNRTPFERFENVLRKVVAVPKAEVDKRRRPTR